MAGVVEDADGLGIFMIPGDEVLQALPSARVLPDIRIEKLLQSARGDVVEQGHRLNALALQMAELPADVMQEMSAWLGPPEAVGEFVQEFSEGGAERKNLIDGHP
jgi:hypothetical protein